VLWTGAGSTADGTWFAVDGEGQASDTGAIADFCAFSGTTVQGVASGVYAAGTASNARGNLNSYYASAFPGGKPLQRLNRKRAPSKWAPSGSPGAT